MSGEDAAQKKVITLERVGIGLGGASIAGLVSLFGFINAQTTSPAELEAQIKPIIVQVNKNTETINSLEERLGDDLKEMKDDMDQLDSKFDRKLDALSIKLDQMFLYPSRSKSGQ